MYINRFTDRKNLDKQILNLHRVSYQTPSYPILLAVTILKHQTPGRNNYWRMQTWSAVTSKCKARKQASKQQPMWRYAGAYHSSTWQKLNSWPSVNAKTKLTKIQSEWGSEADIGHSGLIQRWKVEYGMEQGSPWRIKTNVNERMKLPML